MKVRNLIAAVALAASGIALVPATASAAVTNCQYVTNTTSSTGYHHGGCFSTSANPPYTTQWALIGECRASNGTRTSTTSGWRNAGSTGFAYCPTGWKGVAGTGYFLFR